MRYYTPIRAKMQAQTRTKDKPHARKYPPNAAYRRFASKVRTRGKNFPSNLTEIPQPTPASLGVETACAGMPAPFKSVSASSACARDRKTANIVMFLSSSS